MDYECWLSSVMKESWNERIPIIGDGADDHDVTSPQVILRWHIQDGYIAIPGSSNAEHIAENYDLFDFELSEEEMRKIEAINEQRRYENW